MIQASTSEVKLLKRAAMSTVDLLRYYESVIRPVAEYACVVWHSSLTKDQSARLESIQRRALKLIYGRDNHEMNMLPSLADRREDLAKRFFNSLINPTNCLHYLLPPKRDINVISKLRHVKLFACPTTRTERFKNSTIIYALNNFQ